MNSKQLLSVVAIMILTSTVLLVTSTFASNDPLKLPSTSVILVANNGTQAFFDITLSGVPSGYDVSNGTYLGWCIDIRTEMEFSVKHHVTLHSSLNPDVLTDEEWDMVNYILNHKQGDRDDIQQAIWYFINLDSGYTPKTTKAQAMVNDAVANGTDFVPTTGQKAAIIAIPDTTFPGAEDVQISIIEVTIPPSGSEPTPTPSQTTPTPTPSSQPGSSPTPTPSSQEPDQASPTPDNTNNGSNGSSGTTGNDALLVIGIIVALAAIAIVALLIFRRRRK